MILLSSSENPKFLKESIQKHSNISVGMIACGGNPYFSPEISFRYIKADTVKIDTMLMSQSLFLDFLCAKTSNTTISLDPLPIKGTAYFNQSVYSTSASPKAPTNGLDTGVKVLVKLSPMQ